MSPAVSLPHDNTHAHRLWATAKQERRPQVRFLYGDATNLLHIPSRSHQLLYTSPPYNQRMNYGARISDDLPWTLYQEHALAATAEFARILEPGGTAILQLPDDWGKPQSVLTLWQQALSSLIPMVTDVIWYKKGASHYQFTGNSSTRRPLPKTDWTREHLLFFRKPGQLLSTGPTYPLSQTALDYFARGIIECSPASTRAGRHPCPSPQRLVCEAIGMTHPAVGMRILDPYAGSGTVGLCAEAYGLHATLLDLNPETLHQAQKRFIATLHACGSEFCPRHYHPA